MAAQKKDIEVKLAALQAHCATVLHQTNDLLQKGQAQITSDGLQQPPARVLRLETSLTVDYLPTQKKIQNLQAPPQD